MSFEHEPVMLDEILDVLAEVPTGCYVDATLGGAGHASALLERRDDLTLLGIDRDPVARAAAETRLARFGARAGVVAGRFDEIGTIAEREGVAADVTAILFDLGVSSPQLDRAERGFSYRLDGPLDMRMTPDDGVTAGDIVNDWDAPAIADLLRSGADERFAMRIARAIVANRPIATTTQLAAIVVEAIPAATRRTGGHPAKRTFQALRIAVNDELDQLRPALEAAIDLLQPDGRGAVLSYHSGEDRIVKAVITEASTGGCTCPAGLPCVCGAEASVEVLRPRLRRPTEAEVARNPRASAARLRCFRRLAAASADGSRP